MAELFTERVVLENHVVRLEPLTPLHREELIEAADGVEDNLWYTTAPTPETIDADIEMRLDLLGAGSMQPWVIRRLSDDRVVGETTFCNIDQANRRVEVGHTWLSPLARRTPVNPAAKRLLFERAFEQCDAIAIALLTHFHNFRSRAAIERLGAKQDGVIRNHRLGPDGSLRDTVIFSILPHEWPAVRLGLDARIGGA